MGRGNLPDDIVRLLSFHGPVEVWTGHGELASTARVHLAPFDDELILLVPPQSPLVAGVMQTPAATVTAKVEDQRYALRLQGRAVPGRLVSAHPNRSSITPWLPEGEQPHRFLAIPFVVDSVELVREEGQVRNRYAGPTPTGRALPSLPRRWVSSAFGEGGRWPVFASLVLIFLWFGFLGAEQPWRPLGVLIAWIAALGLIAGIRLIGQGAAFEKWLRGDGKAEDAPTIRDGWIAPGEARFTGTVALVAAAVALTMLGFMHRGGATVLVVLLASGSPVLALAWLLHGTVASREPGES